MAAKKKTATRKAPSTPRAPKTFEGTLDDIASKRQDLEELGEIDDLAAKLAELKASIEDAALDALQQAQASSSNGKRS